MYFFPKISYILAILRLIILSQVLVLGFGHLRKCGLKFMLFNPTFFHLNLLKYSLFEVGGKSKFNVVLSNKDFQIITGNRI